MIGARNRLGDILQIPISKLRLQKASHINARLTCGRRDSAIGLFGAVDFGSAELPPGRSKVKEMRYLLDKLHEGTSQFKIGLRVIFYKRGTLTAKTDAAIGRRAMS